MNIPIYTVSKSVREALMSCHGGRVHSVYRKTINIILDNGFLVALQDKNSVLSPISIRTALSETELSGLNIVVDSRVLLEKSSIIILPYALPAEKYPAKTLGSTASASANAAASSDNTSKFPAHTSGSSVFTATLSGHATGTGITFSFAGSCVRDLHMGSMSGAPPVRDNLRRLRDVIFIALQLAPSGSLAELFTTQRYHTSAIAIQDAAAVPYPGACSDNSVPDRWSMDNPAASSHGARRHNSGSIDIFSDHAWADVSCSYINQAFRLYMLYDNKSASEALTHLIGLGCGLTPAGDDFLCGILAALYMAGASQYQVQTVAPVAYSALVPTGHNNKSRASDAEAPSSPHKGTSATLDMPASYGTTQNMDPVPCHNTSEPVENPGAHDAAQGISHVPLHSTPGPGSMSTTHDITHSQDHIPLQGTSPAVILASLGAAVSGSLSRTNDISAAFLNCALRGEFSEAVLELAQGAARASSRTAAPCLSPASVASAFSRIGHTSGFDTLAGIYYALWLLIQD